MSDQWADVLLHVNETLDEGSLRRLEDEINENVGVMGVAHHPRRPHLLKVDYDAEISRPQEFLRPIRRQGLHAQLVGL